jgi:hypothetical protein
MVCEVFADALFHIVTHNNYVSTVACGFCISTANCFEIKENVNRPYKISVSTDRLSVSQEVCVEWC